MPVDQPMTRKEKLRGQPTVASILLNIQPASSHALSTLLLEVYRPIHYHTHSKAERGVVCPCVCLKVNMSILCGLEKLLDHCRERDFI